MAEIVGAPPVVEAVGAPQPPTPCGEQGKFVGCRDRYLRVAQQKYLKEASEARRIEACHRLLEMAHDAPRILVVDRHDEGDPAADRRPSRGAGRRQYQSAGITGEGQDGKADDRVPESQHVPWQHCEKGDQKHRINRVEAVAAQEPGHCQKQCEASAARDHGESQATATQHPRFLDGASVERKHQGNIQPQRPVLICNTTATMRAQP